MDYPEHTHPPAINGNFWNREKIRHQNLRKIQLVSILFNYSLAHPPYTPRFRRRVRPLQPSQPSLHHPQVIDCLKDNWLKLKSTDSRVLLVNVNESGPAFKFWTFFLLEFKLSKVITFFGKRENQFFHEHIFSWF